MKHRDRQLAAIRRQVPDRVPVDAINIEIGPAIAAYLGVRPEEVLAELGLDGRLVGVGYAGELPPSPAGEEGNEWGTSAWNDYSMGHRYPLAEATLAGVERHRWPDPGAYDFAGAAGAARRWCPEYAVRGPYWQPLFCRVCSLMGMENALVEMARGSALFEATLEQVLARTGELCRRCVERCGEAPDIFCLGDDFATQREMLFDPAQWRRFLKPCFARLFAIGKQAGKPIWFHSCGDVTAVLPDLIDIGMDVWETVQLHTVPLSPEELERQYGKHPAFFGGINTQRLPFARPQEVQEEVARCIRALGEGGGYICGPDHHLKPDVPAGNAVALFRAAVEFRQAGITRG
jgi:uroporphyrinogen decarboxylase